jgi:uncharacterized protein YkwD
MPSPRLAPRLNALCAVAPCLAVLAGAAGAQQRADVVPDPAARDAELQREIDEELRRALARPEAAWRKFLDQACRRGPEALGPLCAVLLGQRQALVDQLAEHAFRRTYDRLAAERRALDAARERALELIFDEQRYFYPFAPPAVDADRAAAYWAVQREIDERVAALRALWERPRARAAVPAALAVAAAQVRWLGGALQELGVEPPAVDDRIGWVLTLPPRGTALSLRSFCWTADERARAAEWDQVEELSARLGAALPAGERRQVEITNAYRRMLGRRPLAIDAALAAAARGHSEEMSKLGFFGHTSPTPGRQTPQDRARLAGYRGGVTENCAMVDGAHAAHDLWVHSAGHHRNLLAASHTEIGVGNAGRYWTQNFGSGAGYREQLGQPRAGR